MLKKQKYLKGKYYLPYDPNQIQNAKVLRSNLTIPERKLWFKVLQNKNFMKLRFLRQRTIGNFTVDFYCAALKLVIEIDGDSHAERKQYDLARTELLKTYGITVIRYANRDILGNLQGVYDDLVLKVQQMIPPTPRAEGGLKI